MSPLKWLGRARAIAFSISCLEAELETIRARMENVTPTYNGDGGTGTKDPHKLDALAVAVGDLQARYDEQDAAKLEIRKAINKLPNTRERLALRLYYLRGMSWPQVAEAMHVSVRRVLDIRKDAIKHIEPIIEEVVND